MPPPQLDLTDSYHHSNASEYTLSTVRYRDDDDSRASSPITPLLVPVASYGATMPLSPTVPPANSRKLIFNAALKMSTIFVVSTILLGGTLWLALPTLEEEDRPLLRIPKSFAQLQSLNFLLKKYRDIYPYRIVVCYVITYLFLQAFSLPGSMYLSILGGAVWGVPRALPLACACVATGATLCYLISAALGPALLTLPKWKAKLDKWADKIQAQRENIISFLIILRIAPLPPHWVVNVICPHVGIGLAPFWISTFFGILGVSVIHTTIGGSLDQMTSADDFHLISWRNFLGLSAVVVGVLIPVGLRYFFGRELASVQAVEDVGEGEAEEEAGEDQILAMGPRAAPKYARDSRLVLIDDDEAEEFAEYEDQDEDEDIILEAGPALVLKPDDAASSSHTD